MRSVMLPLSLAALSLTGCASTPPTPVSTEAAADQHEQLADMNAQAAAKQAAKYDPAARQTQYKCTGRGGGRADIDIEMCWTSEVNPTADHLKKAQRLHALAEEQRATSEKLRQAEQSACTGVSELDRTMSPFSHPEDVAAVTPLKSAAARPEGALISFRAIDGMTAPRLEKLVNCQLARNACLEHESQEMAYCPLVLRNVKATVTPTNDGLFSVSIRSDDPSIAQEVLRRSEALVVH